MKKILPLALMTFTCLFSPLAFAKADLTNRADIKEFITHMATKHGLDQATLESWFKKIQINQTIIDQMNHPAEAKPWHVYQKIFITEQNIKNGAIFWKENEKTLKEAEKQYGVPPEIIVGILGVETKYGKNTGNFPVLEALTTLAFDYPKRAPFFKKELEEYLLLVKEQQFDPFELKGSYAGAMGIPQFISSSYRNFAVDFHQKGQKDILTNNADAIGSVANYFKLNGWEAHQPVVVSALPYGEKYAALPRDKKNPKPTHTVLEWIKKYDVSPSEDLPNITIKQLSGQKAALIELEKLDSKEYFLGLNNFYVITRYNHSDHYAMAVHQLGQAIKNRISQND
jgi:membrane-bound lytic murein transglycosylase B